MNEDFSFKILNDKYKTGIQIAADFQDQNFWAVSEETRQTALGPTGSGRIITDIHSMV